MTHSHTKQALLNRLDNALSDIYHNATPYYLYVDGELSDTYWNCFNMWAESEIDYLQDNLGATDKEYNKALKLYQPSERYFYLVSQMSKEFGKLYTWGRGGRTLAPINLINRRGGSSFSIKSADCFENCSNETLTRYIQIVEAFNKYVENWNKKENLQNMWEDELLTERAELTRCAKDTRKTLKKLAVESKALINIAGSSACNVLQREIAKQKLHHKELINRIALINSELKGL